MHDAARVANLLGAAGLGVADVVRVATSEMMEMSPSAAAAVVALRRDDGLSGTELGRRIGLTQSAAARMVDSLESQESVRREPGSGRAVAVRLTDGGRAAADVMLEERQVDLAYLLADLDDDERATLGRLLEKVLVKLYETTENADHLCRLCDRAACTKDAVCPVGQAERDHA